MIKFIGLITWLWLVGYAYLLVRRWRKQRKLEQRRRNREQRHRVSEYRFARYRNGQTYASVTDEEEGL